MLSFIRMKSRTDEFPKFVKYKGESYNESHINGGPDIGRELSAHRSALYGEGELILTKCGIKAQGGSNIAKETVGRKIHSRGPENNGIENEPTEYKGDDGQDNHGQYRTDQMPAQFLQMVKERHFVGGLGIGFAIALIYRIPSLIKLCKCTTPLYFFPSTPNNCEMPLFCISSKASMASTSMGMVFGFEVMISLAMRPLILSYLLSILRISPSVMIPTIPSFWVTAVTPSIFSEISTITCLTGVSILTSGF